MNKVKPIKPSEVIKKKEESIPDEVFEAFNEMIAETFDGYSSHFQMKKVASLALKKLKVTKPKTTINDIFDNDWLDVEKIYEKAGWDVVYDKAGYNETYEDTFEFTKKK
jgi:hypothetical protein